MVWYNNELQNQNNLIQYVPGNPVEADEADSRKRQNNTGTAKFLWEIPNLGLKSNIHRIKSQTILIWGRKTV